MALALYTGPEFRARLLDMPRKYPGTTLHIYLEGESVKCELSWGDLTASQVLDLKNEAIDLIAISQNRCKLKLAYFFVRFTIEASRYAVMPELSQLYDGW